MSFISFLGGQNRTIARCDYCGGLVKPDIVFFGEALPHRFFHLLEEDEPECDLLIVMGSSLVVQPFASIVSSLPSDSCPRLLINREVVGEASSANGFGFWFGEGNTRDAKYIGDCDDGVRELAQELGWLDDLMHLHSGGESRSSDKVASEKTKPAQGAEGKKSDADHPDSKDE